MRKYIKNSFFITIKEENKENKIIHYNKSIFPAWEIFIKLIFEDLFILKSNKTIISIEWIIKNSNDIIELLLIKNALDEKFGFTDYNSELTLKYLPYSRQDRVCSSWESFSIKIFANLINNMKFSKIITFDNHSPISSKLINNIWNYSQLDLFQKYFKDSIYKFSFLCSPDLGSVNKVSDISKHYNIPQITGRKIRNKDWKIISTEIITNLSKTKNEQNIIWKNILIIDDILDWGSTIVKLVEALKEKKAWDISVYITHWIFSKGIDYLIKNGIKHIYTTNSFYQWHHKNISIINES